MNRSAFFVLAFVWVASRWVSA